MRYVLLFDSHCGSCSDIARQAEGISNLEVRSLHEPEIVARLQEVGLGVPSRPALLCEGETCGYLLAWPCG